MGLAGFSMAKDGLYFGFDVLRSFFGVVDGDHEDALRRITERDALDSIRIICGRLFSDRSLCSIWYGESEFDLYIDGLRVFAKLFDV